MRICTFVLVTFILIPSFTRAQTLKKCQESAEKNYPIIKQYDLINQTTELTIKNIQKGWLPQITATGQASCQSDVMSWPERMQSMFQRLGLKMKGLSKEQYKVGIELQQALYDGGAIKSQSKIVQQEGAIQAAQNKVNLYQVRNRVNEMYFSLLLLYEQIKLNEDTRMLLLSNENKLSALVKGGTAATSDFENVRAERLNTEQQNTSLKAQQQMLQRMLSVFCGIEVVKPQKPDIVDITTATNHRPELIVFDNQLQLAKLQESALDTKIRPRLGLFAQGYYGYPSLNMFEDMMSRKWRLNGLVGLKLSWNVSAFYTRKVDKEKLARQCDMIENAREVFLFNNKLEQIQQTESIQRYRKMMQSDDEIIALRRNIRKAAESKLAHGIIDVTGLIREINNENAAKTQQDIHEIEMLKEMYQLKYTNNE